MSVMLEVGMLIGIRPYPEWEGVVKNIREGKVFIKWNMKPYDPLQKYGMDFVDGDYFYIKSPVLSKEERIIKKIKYLDDKFKSYQEKKGRNLKFAA